MNTPYISSQNGSLTQCRVLKHVSQSYSSNKSLQTKSTSLPE